MREISLSEEPPGEEKYDYIVKQLIIASIYNESTIDIKKKNTDTIIENIIKILQSFLNSSKQMDSIFLIRNSLKEIRSYYNKKPSDIYIKECLISMLIDEQHYTPREDPNAYYNQLIEDTKKVIKQYEAGEVVDLPIKLNPEAYDMVYLLTVKKEWFKKETGINTDKLNSIIKRYGYDKDDRIRKELLKTDDPDFINRLYEMSDRDLRESIDNYIDVSGEIEGLFDKVKQSSPSLPYDAEEFLNYKEGKYKQKESEPGYTAMRDEYADVIYRMFNQYGLPRNYNRKKPATLKYVRNVLLPFIMFFNRYKKESESRFYSEYIIDYMSNEAKINNQNRYPSYIMDKVGKYLRDPFKRR